MGKEMRIGIISGYFNPLRTGHLDYIEAARENCNSLYVIVNNDEQVNLKGSTPFMDSESRRRIVGALGAVGRAIVAIDKDESVLATLKCIYEKYCFDVFVDSITFMNGGDRVEGNTPEEEYCKNVGIHTLYGVGGTKTESSSNLLSNRG